MTRLDAAHRYADAVKMLDDSLSNKDLSPNDRSAAKVKYMREISDTIARLGSNVP